MVLVCHSQGANAALALQALLSDGSFAGHATSAEWVAGVVAIAAPFRGAGPALRTFGRVPRATLRAGGVCGCARCGGCSGGGENGSTVGNGGGDGEPRRASGWQPCARLEQSVGPRLAPVTLSITLGYVAHILLGWSAAAHAVFEWQLDRRLPRSATAPKSPRRRRRVSARGRAEERGPHEANVKKIILRLHARRGFGTRRPAGSSAPRLSLAAPLLSTSQRLSAARR